MLNIISIIKTAGIEFKWGSFCIKPLVSALIMGAAAYLMIKALPTGGIWCIIEIGLCVLIYAASALAVRAVRKEDVVMLPKGEKIAKLMQKYKLLK